MRINKEFWKELLRKFAVELGYAKPDDDLTASFILFRKERGY